MDADDSLLHFCEVSPNILIDNYDQLILDVNLDGTILVDENGSTLIAILDPPLLGLEGGSSFLLEVVELDACQAEDRFGFHGQIKIAMISRSQETAIDGDLV
jgi:hypothetical protein